MSDESLLREVADLRARLGEAENAVRDLRERDATALAEDARGSPAGKGCQGFGLPLVDALMRTVPVGFGFLDRELRFVKVNQRLAEMNGMEVAGHIGRKVGEILPSHMERFESIGGQIVTTGEPVENFQVSVADPSVAGGVRCWNESWYPVRDEVGEIVGFGVVVEEIIERKAVERALLESQIRLRDAANVGRMTYLDMDLAAGTVHIGENFSAVMGFEPPEGGTGVADLEPMVEAWLGHLPAADREDYAHQYQEFAAGKAPPKTEYRLFGDDGVERWIEAVTTTERDAQGRLWRAFSINRDITQHKLAERALEQNSEMVRGVLDSLPEHIVVLNHDGVVTMVNEPWERFAQANGGDPAAVSVGVNYLDVCRRAIVSGDLSAEIALRGLDEVLSGRLQEFEMEYPYHAPQQERWFLMHAQRASHGPAGMVLSHIDITERRQAEEALQLADRRKDEFLATLAHELRNPMASLRSGLEVMRLASDRPQAIDHTRGIMERQLGQLVRLVDDLLDVSRITYGKLELRKERIDLARVLYSAVETSRFIIEEMGHHLHLALPPEPVILDADHTRLAQVFLNLLTNAAKYSEPHGEIWLTAVVQGPEVIVSVRDRGIGIDPQQLPHIFDLFSQVDRSLEKSCGGLGIGLMLVKHLVGMHGGSVEAKSAGAGLGCEFIVRLPTVCPCGSGREPAALECAHSGAPSRGRVMIADDNSDAAVTAQIFLELMGFEVATAHDGLQAVDVANTFHPAVILLDIGMPGLNGYEACRRIHQQPWSADSTFIALTGWGKDEDREKSRDAGFDHHLVKPVDPAALEHLLDEALAKGR